MITIRTQQIIRQPCEEQCKRTWQLLLFAHKTANPFVPPGFCSAFPSFHWPRVAGASPEGKCCLVQVDHAGPIPLFFPARAWRCAVVLADDTLGWPSQGFQGVHFFTLNKRHIANESFIHMLLWMEFMLFWPSCICLWMCMIFKCMYVCVCVHVFIHNFLNPQWDPSRD